MQSIGERARLGCRLTRPRVGPEQPLFDAGLPVRGRCPTRGVARRGSRQRGSRPDRAVSRRPHCNGDLRSKMVRGQETLAQQACFHITFAYAPLTTAVEFALLHP